MRTHGTLTRWNEDRGFGFIAPAEGGAEVFVHVSALPRDGQRPRLHEVLTFEIEPGPDGRPRAVRVMRPGRSAHAGRTTRPARAAPRRVRMAIVAPVLLLALAGFYGYTRWRPPMEAESPPATARPALQPPLRAFKCDGRTRCPQMTSCAEAEYFIRHCPDTQMDGDGDGVPCEQQWCS